MNPIRVALLPSVLAIAMASCAQQPSTDERSDRPKVVASLYPLQFVAERVAGADADVENLTAPGAEPHDLELTAKQTAELAQADAVLYISGLQAAVDDALGQTSGPELIDAASMVETLPAAEDDEHEHADEVEHPDEEEHADEHDHGATDPHLWQDPRNLTKPAMAIAQALGQADPAHRAGYAARASRLIVDLKRLDAQFREGLATCERRTIVTAHAAFAYLAHAYKLSQVPIAGLDPSHEPTASGLASIAAKVEADGVTTVFTERLVSPAIAETVARETGAKTAVLDPIEGLTEETRRETYLTLMRQNLKTIRAADECS